jgi:hypothetical protein
MLHYRHGYLHGTRTINRATYRSRVSLLIPSLHNQKRKLSAKNTPVVSHTVLKPWQMRPFPSRLSIQLQSSITSLNSPSYHSATTTLPLAGDESPIVPSKQKRSPQKSVRRGKDNRDATLLFDIASAKVSSRIISKRAIELEMAWLNDPLKLADRVAELFRNGDPHRAIVLIRQAQNDGMECIAAWNTLFKYCFECEAPLAAFKFYNDVGNCPTYRPFSSSAYHFYR